MNYTKQTTKTNTAGTTVTVEDYTLANSARRSIWLNKVEPAIKILPDMGENVKFGFKIKAPVTVRNYSGYANGDINANYSLIANPTGQSAGINSIQVTSNSWDYNNPTGIKKQTITTETGVTNEVVITVLEPTIATGLQIYTPTKKLRFNFGLTVALPKYEHREVKKTVKNGYDGTDKSTTVTEYYNGTTTTNVTALPDLAQTESKNVTDTWTFAGIDMLKQISVGLTWFVNQKLTFDVNLGIINDYANLLENPLAKVNAGLTATYRY